MYPQLKTDLSQLDQLLEKVKLQSLNYLKQLDTRITTSSASLQLSDVLPDEGIGGEKTLELFNEKFEPLIVGSGGPRYWGFVTGGSTPASIMGDFLATVYDQNTQAVKGQGDSSANIEFETVNLLLDLFDLPRTFLGGFVTGATMSNFTCLGVARQWVGRQKGIDMARDGVNPGIKILSAVPHSSAIKSLSMLGIGSNNFEKVDILPNREAMDIADLTRRIELLNDEPFIVIASAGTVNTVDYDDFKALAALKEKHKFWLHIDGAFGAFAACSPKHKSLLEGWENADSITIDCHKWMNVPYESAFFLVHKNHHVLQTETFQNSNAPYLGDPLANFNYLNFLPENSRRLKALPTWFSLMAYGKSGYREIVEGCIELAQFFGEKIASSDNFELLAPVRLNNLCFTLKDRDNDAPRFLTALNDSGKVFMTPTVYNGKKGIRASLVNWRTTRADVLMVVDEMVKTLRSM